MINEFSIHLTKLSFMKAKVEKDIFQKYLCPILGEENFVLFFTFTSCGKRGQ